MNNAPTIENVKVGRGAKVHLRYEMTPTTFCGQGLSTRGGRTSPLKKTSQPVTCDKCRAVALEA